MNPGVGSADLLAQLYEELRRGLERARDGSAIDAPGLLAKLSRLEQLTALLRRTALHGFGQFEHRVAELSLIARAAELFGNVFEEERLGRSLLELLEEALPCRAAFLYLEPVEGGEPARVAAVGGPPPPQLADRVERAVRAALQGPDDGAPVVAEGEGEAPERLRVARLVAQRQTLGALVVSEPAAGGAGAGAGRILASLAALAAVAVRHSRLCAANLESRRHLENLVNQRTREVNEAHLALSRLQRTAAMGKLAASIAHEVNNPMSFLASNLERAAEYVADLEECLPDLLALVDAAGTLPAAGDPDAQRAHSLAAQAACRPSLKRLSAMGRDFSDLIEEAREGTDRIRRVGRDLRSFAHGIAGVAEPIDLHRLVDTALHIVRTEAKDRVDFECDFGVLPQLRCQRYQIVQVLLNLLKNAVDAVLPNGGGSVRISTRVVDDFIEVEIADDGPGVAPEDVDRIFEPFRTSKPEGTGLGLSISRDIATAHHGSLDALSRSEGGLFLLRLPIEGPRAGLAVPSGIGPAR